MREATIRWRNKNIDLVRSRGRAGHAWRKWARFNHPDPQVREKISIQWERKNAASRKRGRLYYEKNKEARAESSRRVYSKIRNNPVLWKDRLDRQRERVRQWRIKNPDKFRAGIRRWASTEKGKLSSNASKAKSRQRHPEIMLKHRIRCRISVALKNGYKRMMARTHVLLGCSFPELKIHLESLFLPGMTWENRSLWEIDHIRPCASFDLMDPEQQKCCFHHTNLQPLWKKDNRMKSDKWA